MYRTSFKFPIGLLLPMREASASTWGHLGKFSGEAVNCIGKNYVTYAMGKAAKKSRLAASVSAAWMA